MRFTDLLIRRPVLATVLNLVIASGYLSKLIGNAEIKRYLNQHHPEILTEFRAIISATSLDQANDPA